MSNNIIEELQKRLQSFTPPPSLVSLVRASITRNFRTGGNYGEGVFGGGTKKWKLSKRAIKQHGRTLWNTGALLSSIQYSVRTLPGGGLRIAVTSRSQYANIHQYGGTIKRPARSNTYVQNRYTRGKKAGMYKKGTKPGRGTTFRPYTIEMPRRPFAVLQEYDIRDIEKMIIEHLQD